MQNNIWLMNSKALLPTLALINLSSEEAQHLVCNDSSEQLVYKYSKPILLCAPSCIVQTVYHIDILDITSYRNSIIHLYLAGLQATSDARL